MNYEKKNSFLSKIVGVSRLSTNTVKSRGTILKDADSLSFLKISNKKGNVFENKTKISHISEKTEFNLKEDFEDNKTNNLVDKIITSFGSDPKRLSDSIDRYIGLESAKNEINILKKFERMDKNFSSMSVISPREQNQNCELIEKNYLDTLRKENETYISQIKSYNEQMTEVNKNFSKAAGEHNFLNFVNETQDISSADYLKKIKKLSEETAEANLISRKLCEAYTKETIEKDHMFRALINYTKQFDVALSEELQKIIKSFNNQYFLATFRPTDEKLIEEMLGRIDILEKEIILKNSEIKRLNKLLPTEEKKKEIPNSNALPILQPRKTLPSEESIKKKEVKNTIKGNIKKNK